MAGIADATVQVHPLRTFSLRARIAIFVGIVQSILLLTHWFIYDTWTTFRAVPDRTGLTGLQVTLAVLSVSFVAASLLAFRYYNWPVRASTTCRSLAGDGELPLPGGMPVLGDLLRRLVGWIAPGTFRIGGSALWTWYVLASLYGVLNARWTRIRRIKVKLPDLPVSWRGRVAALVSDVHLGHVNGTGFLRRVVGRLTRLQPDVVFITGDLYDGTKVNAAELASPWKGISPPWGTYFITGNHEEFSDPARYLEAVEQAGVRVLQDEKVLVDGLQIVGVHFHESTNADRFRSVLKKAGIVRQQASILLSHAPHALSIAAEAGISMQLSGHTHGGQIFPFTWFTRRIFGAYTYGLQRFAGMLVYTTTGAGTWGPPMRVGTNPEIVLIEFA